MVKSKADSSRCKTSDHNLLAKGKSEGEKEKRMTHLWRSLVVQAVKQSAALEDRIGLALAQETAKGLLFPPWRSGPEVGLLMPGSLTMLTPMRRHVVHNEHQRLKGHKAKSDITETVCNRAINLNPYACIPVASCAREPP